MTEVISNKPMAESYRKTWNELSIEERRHKIQLAEELKLRGYFPRNVLAETIAQKIYNATRNTFKLSGQLNDQSL